MRRQYSIRVKLPALIALACLVFGLLSWIIIVSQTTKLSNQAVQDKSRSTLKQLAESIRTPLFSNDIIGIQFALRNATEDPAIYSASLYDVANTLIAQSSQSQETPQRLENFRHSIELEDALAGTLTISVISQPIYSAYSQIFLLWMLAWLIFTGASTYVSYQFSNGLSRRLRLLTNRLPGSNDPMIDEMQALEKKIQPLLSASRQLDHFSDNGYYCSLVSATIKNRRSLNKQLSHENLDLLFENIDLCTERTLELYGGQRLEGVDGNICFYIRSTEVSKQHILVCLMAVYSLQQLLMKLSKKLGIDLEINWTVCSDNIPMLPIFSYHENIFTLKEKSKAMAQSIDRDVIAISMEDYTIDKLSSIARFSPHEKDCFIFEGFPEQRQLLLEKQIMHLASVCL